MSSARALTPLFRVRPALPELRFCLNHVEISRSHPIDQESHGPGRGFLYSKRPAADMLPPPALCLK